MSIPEAPTTTITPAASSLLPLADLKGQLLLVRLRAGQIAAALPLIAAGTRLDLQINDTDISTIMPTGFINMLNALAEFSEQVEPICTEHMTALHIAVDAGYLTVIDALLTAGIDVNARGGKGQTALHLVKENLSILTRLLAANPDLSIQDNYGNTALHIAVEHSQVAIAKALLEAGADPTMTNNQHKSPTDLILELNNPNMQSMWEAYLQPCLAAPTATILYSSSNATVSQPPTPEAPNKNKSANKL